MHSMHLATPHNRAGIHLLVYYKRGQVTKPIIVVKMPCELLYTSNKPYLISKFLVAYLRTMLFLICLTFFTARLFLGACYGKAAAL